MNHEDAVTQPQMSEKPVWTTPVLKKGAVGDETALNINIVFDGAGFS